MECSPKDSIRHGIIFKQEGGKGTTCHGAKIMEPFNLEQDSIKLTEQAAQVPILLAGDFFLSFFLFPPFLFLSFFLSFFFACVSATFLFTELIRMCFRDLLYFLRYKERPYTIKALASPENGPLRPSRIRPKKTISDEKDTEKRIKPKKLTRLKLKRRYKPNTSTNRKMGNRK